MGSGSVLPTWWSDAVSDAQRASGSARLKAPASTPKKWASLLAASWAPLLAQTRLVPPSVGGWDCLLVLKTLVNETVVRSETQWALMATALRLVEWSAQQLKAGPLVHLTVLKSMGLKWAVPGALL